MSRPLVYKFGGSSLADAERIRGVARLVRRAERTPVVVVSALGGVTDRLLCPAGGGLAEGPPNRGAVEALRARHREVLDGVCGDPDERARLSAEVDEVLSRLEGAADRGPADGGPADVAGSARAVDRDPADAAELRDGVASVGEDLSARLVACAIRGEGVDARVVDAREVVRTDARFGRARPQEEEIRRLAAERLRPLLERGSVPVIQGFVGATPDGRTTTLGRGGSDLTAALLGAALQAEVVHIWTDVDGILSGDPRAVDRPRILTEIGYEEAVELSYFGATVIHPAAAKHAVSRGVSLRIRNTFRPEDPGTLVLSDRRGAVQIAAVAYKPRVVLIKVRSHLSALEYGFLARVFEVLGRHRVPVDLVATSHSSTAFTIDENEEIGEVARELSLFSDVEVVRDLATLTVVGHGLMEEPGIDALVFWTVQKTPVHLISQASDVSLSFVVSEADARDLARKLHLTLIELRDERGREGVE